MAHVICILFVTTVLFRCCHGEWFTETNKTVTNTIQQTKKTGVATIIFAGDLSLDAPIRVGDRSACAYSKVLANVAPYFKSVDYNMVNLESPFVTRDMAKKTFLPDKGIHNKAWPESIEVLKSAGIRSVSISNNHIMDFGGDSVIFTIDMLQGSYIDVIGMTYGNQAPYTRQTPLIKDLNGVKVGFLAYCGDGGGECERFRPGVKAGPALLDRSTTEQDIKLLRPRVDVLILFLHWGKEYMSIPNEEQREVAISLKNIGVDLIIGSHPHVLQGHEWINNTLVHYSLGNFVFHPHFTFMGPSWRRTKLKSQKPLRSVPEKVAGDDEEAFYGHKDYSTIHAEYVELSKTSRGPVALTELLKVELTKNGVKDAYFLPTRIFVNNKTGCLYPKAKKKDGWLKVCGPEDENCYVPRPGEPVY